MLGLLAATVLVEREAALSVLALCGGEPVRTEPFPDWPDYSAEEEAEAILATLRSGALGPIGGTCNARFEKAFALWCGATGAATCNSGSSALHVALAAVGVEPGDEVIVPVYTYFSSGTSVLVAGAIPVFADIMPGGSCLDPEAFRAAITDRTRAVMVVHADGVPADMDAILAIAETHGVAVVEDCSHAHGATYHGTKTGVLGDVGAFSIQHKKILSVGEGGVVVSRHSDVVDRARSFVNLGNGEKTGLLGPNLRMGEMQGALALVRMKRVDQENVQRRACATRLRELVDDLPGVRPVPDVLPEDAEPSFYNFILAYEAEELGISRQTFAEAVQAEGIPIKCGFYTPLSLMPVFVNRDAWPFRLAENRESVERNPYGEGTCPVGEAFMDKGHLELKVHPPTEISHVEDAGRAIRKVIENVGELQTRRRV